MRINNIFELEQAVTVTVPNTVTDTDIEIFVYVEGTTKETLTFDIDSILDFKYIKFTTPSYDCTVIVKYGTGVEFMRVGNPPVYLLLHYIPYDNEPVTYEQYDYDSQMIKSGDMVDIGDNIYVSNNIDIVKSFYKVMNGIVTLTLPERFYSAGSSSNGQITLERGNWQLIAIPIEGDVATEFVTKLANSVGVADTDLIEVCSAYPGHVNKFLSYIPGFTSLTSEHNFQLTYQDGTSSEVTAFWVKCKEWTHTTDNIVFSWV